MQQATREEILTQLTEFVRTNFPRARRMAFEAGDKLLDRGIIDSLGLLQILSFVEESFGLSVKDSDVTEKNFGSLEAIAGYVKGSMDGSAKSEG